MSTWDYAPGPPSFSIVAGPWNKGNSTWCTTLYMQTSPMPCLSMRAMRSASWSKGGGVVSPSNICGVDKYMGRWASRAMNIRLEWSGWKVAILKSQLFLWEHTHWAHFISLLHRACNWFWASWDCFWHNKIATAGRLAAMLATVFARYNVSHAHSSHGWAEVHRPGTTFF